MDAFLEAILQNNTDFFGFIVDSLVKFHQHYGKEIRLAFMAPAGLKHYSPLFTNRTCFSFCSQFISVSQVFLLCLFIHSPQGHSLYFWAGKLPRYAHSSQAKTETDAPFSKLCPHSLDFNTVSNTLSFFS